MNIQISDQPDENNAYLIKIEFAPDDVVEYSQIFPCCSHSPEARMEYIKSQADLIKQNRSNPGSRVILPPVEEIPEPKQTTPSLEVLTPTPGSPEWQAQVEEAARAQLFNDEVQEAILKIRSQVWPEQNPPQ